MIYIPKKKIKIDDYPAIRDWLLPFRDKLESRATVQEWFELQQAQDACEDSYKGRKIVYGEFSPEGLFSSDEGNYINNKCYFIPYIEPWILAYLNSRVFWLCVTGESVPVRGAFFQMQSQFVEKAPVPRVGQTDKQTLNRLAETAQSAAEQRYSLQHQVARRIPDLRPAESTAKLTNRLRLWWQLSDFAAFQAEIKKAFRTDIPLRERSEWDDWLAESRRKVADLSAQIATAEQQIDEVVYRLFDLTPEEIKLIEDAPAGEAEA